MQIDSELRQLKKELKDWKESYMRMKDQAYSMECRLNDEMEITDAYRAWFKLNAHWVQDHNAQFQAFKNSPFYVESNPQVAQNKEQ